MNRSAIPGPFGRRPCFSNALVQSVAGGNTMVMNRAAFDLLRKTSQRVSYVSHDWWAYIVVTGAGGAVRYVEDSGTRYRQHKGNLVGANRSLVSHSQRAIALINNRYREQTCRAWSYAKGY